MSNYWIRLFWVATYFLKASLYFQDDYNLMLQIVHVNNYNRSYLSSPWASMTWFNRTQRVINANLTLIKDTGRNMRTDAQVYKFMKNANEYRFFPITISVDACKGLQENLYGEMNFLVKYSNLHTCHPKKGFYYIHNGIFNDSMLPPYIPRGNYKLEIKFFSDGDFIAGVDIIGEIVDRKKR